MDVNNVGQNANNINSYSSKSTSSEYTQNSTEVAVPQTQQVPKVETQTLGDNNTKNKEYTKEDVDNAVKKLNNFLKDDKTHAEYTYNEEMKTMMVKVIDESTKEVVLEIPPKKILDMIASMMRQVGLLDEKA